MNFDISPYVRFVAKTTNFIKNEFVTARDCRLLYLISGEGSFETKHEKITLKAGTLIYYPYDLSYRIASSETDGMLFYTVNFDFSQAYKDISTMRPLPSHNHNPESSLNTLDNKTKDDFNRVIHIPSAFWAENDFKCIYKEKLEQRAGYAQVQSLHLKRILINIYRNAVSVNQKNPICERIKEIVTERPDIKNKELAEMVGYHPFYLNQLYKKNEGISLHKYIIKIRAEKAYELLSETRLSLAEISEICGFSSQAHLSSSFKAVYNISPSTLRKC